MKRFLSVIAALVVALVAGVTLSASGNFYGPEGESAFITSGCVGCGACVDECPNGAIFEKDEIFYVNPEKCCGGNTCNMICLDTCPVGAIWIGKASY